MGKPSGGSFVGLDIGSQYIKAVEARGAGRSLTIAAMGMVETPFGAVQQGLIADPKALGDEVKNLLQKSGISAKKCCVSVTGTSAVVVRVIEVPRMTPSELKETMRWEVERHIPFSAADVEMNYSALGSPVAAGAAESADPNMEVLLTVAQRDMVNAYLAILKTAGLQVYAIDVEPLAAGRALINLDKTGLTAKNTVIVNIGASNTDVAIFRKDELYFPRILPIAGDALTSAISNSLGITYEQAEQEKRQYATVLMDMLAGGGGNPYDTGGAGGASPFDFDLPSTPFDAPAPMGGMNTINPGLGGAPPPASPFDLPPGLGGPAGSVGDSPMGGASVTYDPDNPFGTPSPAATVETLDVSGAAMVPDDPRQRRRREIFDAILPTLGELARELRNSVDYFRSKYPNDALDQVLLCGGSSRIENLDQFIQTELGIPTRVASPFEGVAFSSKQMSADRAADVAPAFVVAVGLATRDALMGSD